MVKDASTAVGAPQTQAVARTLAPRPKRAFIGGAENGSPWDNMPCPTSSSSLSALLFKRRSLPLLISNSSPKLLAKIVLVDGLLLSHAITYSLPNPPVPSAVVNTATSSAV